MMETEINADGRIAIEQIWRLGDSGLSSSAIRDYHNLIIMPLAVTVVNRVTDLSSPSSRLPIKSSRFHQMKFAQDNGGRREQRDSVRFKRILLVVNAERNFDVLAMTR
ncbi:hypothetical protein DMN91_012055 [Ooceraea biroi]|uniref:Uncharacterized protein n=1 Tax=Ooceraea biroi TaxID=2015173 RepID=A0A3L8D748_OOCBI|nr:hypothetical protein DMN91_012055 [Ooceraea biroi]